ncbi:hypothetical protein KAR91_69105 [Candidatus Pacearchaeota archaeon]|nr:hypothetical protein [Candidatus Pacearchaeota archaeon]
MPKKPKLSKLDDEENDLIYELAKSYNYTDKQIKNIFKKVDKYELNFKSLEIFVNWRFKATGMDKVLNLSDGYELESLKLINHYVKNGRNQKPKKINDRISQFNRAVTSYGNGLKGIKKREWNPEGIEIPLEGGKKKLMTFKTEEEFNKWKEADVDNVSKHIEHDKDEIEEWTRFKKFKEAL